jgi:TolB-like protein/Tfp pilus assembly protein PilF
MQDLIGRTLGHYQIVEKIGEGGMGEVYRARDERLGRDVAIKVLPAEFAADPERLKRFEREARATAALAHANILAVHDVGTHDGVPYLVEELLEGESLRERLGRGSLTQAEVLRIAGEIAKGLAVAHEKGIVHRDLKPGNVFLTRDGTVKILDFGLAKLVPTVPSSEAETLSQSATGTTALGGVLGTAAYMAPEQARGRPVDQRADVFAFGVVLYEMLTGERPFRGATGTDVLAAILKDEPAALPATVPQPAAEVVARCLAKDPDRRYQRAGEIRAALEAVQSQTVLPQPSWLAARPRRRWLLAAAVAVAAIVAAVGLGPGGVGRRLLGPAGGGRSIRMAVLPFANLSGEPEQEYLSDGLTQEMIAQLGRLHPESLSVIARTSVMRYKKTDTPIDQIGRELGVDYVLEGSAQKEGVRVRVSAELIQVKDQTQLWADSFEREMSGILALQSEVARKVAESLVLKLLPAEQARLAGARQVNPEAYEAYLKGSQHWIRMTRADLDAAEGYFNLALEKDPDFAPAYAGLARVWRVRNQFGYAPLGEAAPKAKEAARKAISLDDTLADAHYALGAVGVWDDWDLAAGQLEFKRAIELDPNNPNGVATYSHFLAITGHVDEAMTEIDRALRLDPFNVSVHAFRAFDLLFARRFDEALAQAQQALAMEPGQPGAIQAQYMALIAKRRYEQALPGIKEFYMQIYDLPDLDAVMTEGFSEGGFEGAMRRAADALSVLADKVEVRPIDVADLYLFAGDMGRALDWLENGYEARDPAMPYICVTPEYDSLRTDPRFQDLLRRMNFPED